MTLLANLREAAEKTQDQVSVDLGISVATLYRHENGKTPLRPIHRTMYGTYYGVDPKSIRQPRKKKPVAARQAA